MERVNSYLTRVFKSVYGNNWWQTLLIISVFALIFILLRSISSDNLDNYYGQLFDPWTSIGTFILAVVFGIRSLYFRRKSELSKLITVHFKIKDPKKDEWKYLLTCHKFSIEDLGDMRSLALQIGSQMTNNSHLSFIPNYDEAPEVEIHYKGVDYMLYETTYYLLELPTSYPNYNYKIWWWNDIKKEHEERILECLGEKALSVEEVIYHNSVEVYNPTKKKPIMVNISNHQFNKEQTIAALALINQYSKNTYESDYRLSRLEYIQFPQIDPHFDENDVKNLVNEYLKKILAYNPEFVCINGEQTFCYQLISVLRKYDIMCFTSTSFRSTFKHVRFREYINE